MLLTLTLVTDPVNRFGMGVSLTQIRTDVSGLKNESRVAEGGFKIYNEGGCVERKWKLLCRGWQGRFRNSWCVKMYKLVVEFDKQVRQPTIHIISIHQFKI